MTEKISIIIPIYNVEKYLNRCVDSVLKQSYKNIEIILVDDGSPDKSGVICDEYVKCDERIVVIHKENGGLSSARNVGIDAATGQYLCFLDSDDYIADTFIERLYVLLKEYDADISQCDFKQTSIDDETSSNAANTNVYANVEMLKNLYNSNYVKSVVACNKLYKKELFDTIRFPQGKIHEDEGTTYKLFFEAKKIVTTTEDLYFYYMAEGSITRSGFSIKKLDYLHVIKERMAFYKANNLSEFYKLDVLRFITSSSLYAGQVEDKKIKKELKKECREKTKEVLCGVYSLRQKIKAVLFFIDPAFVKLLGKR